MALIRTVSWSLITRLTSSVPRLVSSVPPVAVAMAKLDSAGCLEIRLIAAPVVPRPPKVELGPFSTSTCSTANTSRDPTPGSRTPSTKMSLRVSKPRTKKRSPKALPPSPVPSVTPGWVRIRSRKVVAPVSRITSLGITVIDLGMLISGSVSLVVDSRSIL